MATRGLSVLAWWNFLQLMVEAAFRLWPFWVVLSLAALILNWLWEMMQMPAYAEMVGRTWRESLLVCTVAALGDVLLTLGIIVVVTLAFGRFRWAVEPRWHMYASVALLGGVCAAALEWRALAVGRWSYTNWMPILPVVAVGLWPLLQLTLLVPAAMWIASRVAGAPSRRLRP